MKKRAEEKEKNVELELQRRLGESLEEFEKKSRKGFDDERKPTVWEDQALGDPHEAMRVKIIEMLGSEGPQTGDQLEERLPFPRAMVDKILHELETRNVLSVGFYKQTDEAEYILKITVKAIIHVIYLTFSIVKDLSD